MSTVIKSKISRLLDRAEDPAETLDYGYQKQVESLQNVKKGIADVVTSKKRLQMQSQKDKLTESEKKLRAKVEAFRTKKEVIKAQYSAAEAQVKISEAAHGVGEQMADVGLAIQRAEDKTEQMRARAGAVEELEAAGTFEDMTQLGSGQDDIDRELASLGAGQQVDDELAKMKTELGSGGGDKPALEEGK
jgi:phage shock protein A